ncbi:hypothetical protein [Streptomyces fagopyri]|uniref:hypothetical protein n=1 Tax=Streptomyces fagopyri TaxID=2662397 RepID=UPI003712E942
MYGFDLTNLDTAISEMRRPEGLPTAESRLRRRSAHRAVGDTEENRSVTRLLSASPKSYYYLRLLEANVSRPRVRDLVFHSSDDLKDASAEQIVDEGAPYRPIALVGGVGQGARTDEAEGERPCRATMSSHTHGVEETGERRGY